jgi:hypothetical protein
LNSIEIDQCIADTLDREERKAEVVRRADWAKIKKNATDFTSFNRPAPPEWYLPKNVATVIHRAEKRCLPNLWMMRSFVY